MLRTGCRLVTWLTICAGLILPPAPAFARFPETGKRVYFLTRAQDLDSEVQIPGRAVHYGFQLFKLAVIGQATYMVGPGTMLAACALQIAKSAVYIRMNSATDHALRQAYKGRVLLHSIARIPGVSSARLFSSSTPEFEGPLLLRMHNTGYVLVETDGPLQIPADLQEEFGEPFELTDLEHSQLELTLEIDGKPSEVKWSVSLKDVLNGATVDPDVADAWRPAVAAFQEERTFFERYLVGKRDFDIKITAKVEQPDGATLDVGTLFAGNKVTKFLRMAPMQKTWDYVRSAVGKEPKETGKIKYQSRGFWDCERRLVPLTYPVLNFPNAIFEK